jgi:hypothetical protein
MPAPSHALAGANSGFPIRYSGTRELILLSYFYRVASMLRPEIPHHRRGCLSSRMVTIPHCQRFAWRGLGAGPGPDPAARPTLSDRGGAGRTAFGDLSGFFVLTLLFRGLGFKTTSLTQSNS